MRIMIFTEGTIIMHANANAAKDYPSYVPIGDAAQKIKAWKGQGAEILYLTSRTQASEVKIIRDLLGKYGFTDGQLLFRKKGEAYRDAAERIVPEILIEDDCESIGGKDEMTITHVRPEIKKKIKSIVVKEFGGIDELPDEIYGLMMY